MFRKMMIPLTVFLAVFFFNVQTMAATKIEVFHINKGKVVDEVPVSEVIHKHVETILGGITDIYREFEPIPKNGHMVKIPLEPAIKVENEWLNENINEVILIFPEYENPHIMVFNEENLPYFFLFNASVDGLITELDLKLKGMKEGRT